mmetsp:Transcript_21100/g.35949  ORF Transcript_21100/g.35949 Transcript_21100/m.35949 type:complete len:216 (+) Transcript_21100:55-702(+)
MASSVMACSSKVSTLKSSTPISLCPQRLLSVPRAAPARRQPTVSAIDLNERTHDRSALHAVPIRGAQLRTRAAASNPAPSSSDSSNHAGHAVLHDFCMTLPYGAATLAGALACFLIGATLKALALPLAGVGAFTLLSSVISLKQWKQGNNTAPYTLASAGAACYAAYICYPLVQGATLSAWVAGGLAAFSGAAALFCLYNVVAGGNPPPSAKKIA